MTSHTGTETRSRLLREAAVGKYCTMSASLMQPCRVYEEGLPGLRKVLFSGEEGVVVNNRSN